MDTILFFFFLSIYLMTEKDTRTRTWTSLSPSVGLAERLFKRFYFILFEMSREGF